MTALKKRRKKKTRISFVIIENKKTALEKNKANFSVRFFVAGVYDHSVWEGVLEIILVVLHSYKNVLVRESGRNAKHNLQLLFI